MIDAKKNLEAFGRALGNEKRTIACVAEAMQNVENNDASQLSKMIEMAKRRGDVKAVSAMRFFFGKVWEGVKIETPEKKPAVVKIKGTTFNADALAIIVQGGADGLALRGPAIRNRFVTEAAPKRNLTPWLWFWLSHLSNARRYRRLWFKLRQSSCKRRRNANEKSVHT